MPCSWIDALSSAQSCWVGMCTPESAKSCVTFAVSGTHAASVYLSKNSPDAYFESQNPSNTSPRSIEMRFDARSAWNSTV